MSPVVRNKVIRMRRMGKSYSEINAQTGVPKSTLSGWLKDVSISKQAQMRLQARMKRGSLVLIERNKQQTEQAEKRAANDQLRGVRSIRQLSNYETMLVGAALYWAEGYKRLQVRDGRERMSHAISFVNADPEMIRVFINFLRKVLEVKPSEIILVMRLYPQINETKSKTFWKDATGLSESNFRKTTWLTSKASKGKRPKNRLPHGTLQVLVNSTQKFHYTLGLIDGIQKKCKV